MQGPVVLLVEFVSVLPGTVYSDWVALASDRQGGRGKSQWEAQVLLHKQYLGTYYSIWRQLSPSTLKARAPPRNPEPVRARSALGKSHLSGNFTKYSAQRVLYQSTYQ
jgi:hypothetical protein